MLSIGSGADGGMWAYPPGGSIRSGSGTGLPNMFGGTGLSMAILLGGKVSPGYWPDTQPGDMENLSTMWD